MEAEMGQKPVDADELARIRGCLAQENALGDDRFQAMVEKAQSEVGKIRLL